ncbi:hypothetical protein IWZ03DRAFT_369807 [Phyllosticta citriasiana]|uniref:Secreted protein n=1 Tax=Phyllosticta citriasiana TaxID=595635 RepID=A0ABR1KW94_9PEZI
MRATIFYATLITNQLVYAGTIKGRAAQQFHYSSSQSPQPSSSSAMVGRKRCMGSERAGDRSSMPAGQPAGRFNSFARWLSTCVPTVSLSSVGLDCHVRTVLVSWVGR